MTKEDIIKAIEEKSQIIAEAVVDRQYKLQPHIWEPYGEKGRELGIRDILYTLPYFTEAIKASDTSLFVNYVLWLKELFAGLNFPDEVLPVTLECMRDVMAEMLAPETNTIIGEYISAGLKQLGNEFAKQISFIPDGSPYADLARSYLDALLQAKRDDANRMIMNAVKQGVSVRDIYLHVFHATQYEIGRLWHLKQVTVAQEHYCSAATERIMSQLYAHVFTTNRIGKTYIGACVGGELHQIGARMVADFFEMEGWDTYYMGANTPTPSILQTIIERNADILGLSMSISFHRSKLEELIQTVRESQDVPKNLKIMVGGYYFIQNPGIWKIIGADGSAKNAPEAVGLANSLVAEG